MLTELGQIDAGSLKRDVPSQLFTLHIDERADEGRDDDRVNPIHVKDGHLRDKAPISTRRRRIAPSAEKDGPKNFQGSGEIPEPLAKKKSSMVFLFASRLRLVSSEGGSGRFNVVADSC
jgi:hypothetical protein